MSISRRTFSKLTLAAFGAGALGSTARAVGLPAPFDKPGSVRMALVRYLSTGDFFQSYLAGAKEQAEALGVDLHVFDSRQDAERQADMVDQAIALGVDGIIIQHGLTESLKEAAQRAVEAGIKVVAFDVNVENDKIPQVEQSDRDLARLDAGAGDPRTMAKAGRPAMSTSRASLRSIGATRPGTKFKAQYPGSQGSSDVRHAR